MKNRFGLSRTIPTSIARQIRREAGFGCVICGLAIATYEHIEPEFAQARKHDPKKMTFLCHQCAGKHTRKQLSKATIFAAKLKPFARQNGFSFEAFDMGQQHPLIEIGPMQAIRCASIITANGVSILSIAAPEILGGPFRINALFNSFSGMPVLEIRNNEWRANAYAWDIVVSGARITIKDSNNVIVLQIRVDAGKSIEFERLLMFSYGHKIELIGPQLIIQTLGGQRINVDRLLFSDCLSAITISDNGVSLGQDGKMVFSGHVVV